MYHDPAGKYAGLSSPVHSLDPRTKIAGALALVLSVVMLPGERPWALAAAGGALAGLAAVSQVPPVFILGRCALVLPFAGLAGIFIPFTHPFPEGLAILGLLVARAMLAAAAVVILISTTRFSPLLRGLEILGVPRILVTLVSFTYRFLFVLVSEARRLETAVRSRAPFRRGRFRALAGAAGVLFIRTYERAERVYQAMLARGFDGNAPAAEPLRFAPRDAVAAVTLAAFLAVLWGTA